MITRTFTVEQLRAWGLPTGGDEHSAQILHDESIGHRRWTDERRCVFRAPDDGLVYRVVYSKGLTEHNEEQPWEYANEVTGVRVMGQERTVIVWVQVKDT